MDIKRKLSVCTNRSQSLTVTHSRSQSLTVTAHSRSQSLTVNLADFLLDFWATLTVAHSRSQYFCGKMSEVEEVKEEKLSEDVGEEEEKVGEVVSEEKVESKVVAEVQHRKGRKRMGWRRVSF